LRRACAGWKTREQKLDLSKEWIVSNAAGTPLLSARGLRKEHGKGEGSVRAVDGVDLDVGAGETVAITGPSG
jgi:ABC-type glutathione transport system ATPase component